MIIRERELTRQKRLAEEERVRQITHLVKFIIMSRESRSLNFFALIGQKIHESVNFNGKLYEIDVSLTIDDVYKFNRDPSSY